MCLAHRRGGRMNDRAQRRISPVSDRRCAAAVGRQLLLDGSQRNSGSSRRLGTAALRHEPGRVEVRSTAAFDRNDAGRADTFISEAPDKSQYKFPLNPLSTASDAPENVPLSSRQRTEASISLDPPASTLTTPAAASSSPPRSDAPPSSIRTSPLSKSPAQSTSEAPEARM